MSGRPPNVYAAMGVARTFQQTQLFGRMTVLENMLVPGLARPHSTWDEVAPRAPLPRLPVALRRRAAAGEEPFGRATEAAGARALPDAGARSVVPGRAVRG